MWDSVFRRCFLAELPRSNGGVLWPSWMIEVVRVRFPFSGQRYEIFSQHEAILDVAQEADKVLELNQRIDWQSDV